MGEPLISSGPTGEVCFRKSMITSFVFDVFRGVTRWYKLMQQIDVILLMAAVSRCGLAVRRLAGKQKDLGSIRFGSPFSSLQNLWFMDTVL